jgi:hypothetical protein
VAGGAGSGGNINVSGQVGNASNIQQAVGSSGLSASSFAGAGAFFGTTQNVPLTTGSTNGLAFGNGGTCANIIDGAPVVGRTGGTGGGGVVIVEEFY